MRAVGELRASARARAYVEVQNGCDHRCTFCIIPFGRGNSRSIPAGAGGGRGARPGPRRLRRGGADRRRPDQLGRGPRRGAARWARWCARILRRGSRSCRACGSPRSTPPRSTPSCWRCLAGEPRLCPHLHLSLQSGDDLILKRMKRRHSSRRRAGADRRGAPRAAGHRLRRRLHRRLPDRDRRRVREHAGVRRSGRASPTCTSSPTARGPARRPRGCRRWRAAVVKDRAARLRAAGDAALAPPPGPPGRPHASRRWSSGPAGPARPTSPRSPSSASAASGADRAHAAHRPRRPPRDRRARVSGPTFTGGCQCGAVRFRVTRPRPPRQPLPLPHVPEGVRRAVRRVPSRWRSATSPGPAASASASRAPTPSRAASAATAARR